MSAQGGKVSLLQRIKYFFATDAEPLETPGSLQPPPPVTTVRGGMDKVTVRKKLPCADEHRRRTDRYQPLAEKQPALCTLPKMTVAEQNCTVVRFAAEVHLVHIHPDAGYLDSGSGVVFTEIVEHVQKPSHAKRRGSFETQKLTVTSEGITGPLYAHEPPGRLTGQGTTRLAYSYARPVSPEKFTVKPRLKCSDVPAKGRLNYNNRYIILNTTISGCACPVDSVLETSCLLNVRPW